MLHVLRLVSWFSLASARCLQPLALCRLCRLQNGVTPLLIAVENAHLGLLRVLLEAGANPNLADTVSGGGGLGGGGGVCVCVNENKTNREKMCVCVCVRKTKRIAR